MKPLVLLLLAVAPPLLPDDSAPQQPAQLRVEGQRAIPPASWSDAKQCGECHLDIAAQWRSSAHAMASFNNPLYRVSVDTIRAERSTTASRMCGSCHDLAVLTAGAMDEPVVAPEDERAHAGVTCTTCHSVVHATRDGNGSATLRSDAVFPDTHADATLEKHRARVASTTLRTAELCGTCHRSFLEERTGNGSAFFGMDDYGAWQKSAYAGQGAERPDHVEAQDCKACHMPREPAVLGDVAAKKGTVPSHRFLGAHTGLAAMRGDAEHLRRTQAFLEKAATVDLAAAKLNDGPWLMPATRAQPKAGDVLSLDVVLFNARTGHRFPGGVLDNQDTRVEVLVSTARGAPVALSDEHEVRSQVVDAKGRPVQRRQTHEFVTSVWNHTVPARDARVTRVRLTVPTTLEAAEFPLRVTARLTHRARTAEMTAAACADAKTERGRAFAETAKRVTGWTIDGCAEQPLTVIDRADVALDGSAAKDEWRRAFNRGLGLAYALQEYLDEAEQAFTHARALAQGRDLATVHWALGYVAGKRGQLEQALAWLTLAEKGLGPTAAIFKARGDAYGQVWQWTKAANEWRRASALAPGDLTVWASLAMAEASVGRYAQALAAAQKGLELFPRDGDCLRVQALALQQLGAPADHALDVALTWRTPDDGPRAKALCSARVPGCAQRRNPVPVYEARPPAAGGGVSGSR